MRDKLISTLMLGGIVAAFFVGLALTPESVPAGRLTVTTIQGPYPVLSLSAVHGLACTTSELVRDGSNELVITGDEILVFRCITDTTNEGHGATTLANATFTINSVADRYGRERAISGVISPGSYCAFHFDEIDGWRTAGGVAYVSSSSGIESIILKYH